VNTATNIATTQISGSTSSPLSTSSAKSSQGLLGFLESFIQQMQSGSATASSAQTSTQGLNTLAEKIAALLNKAGVSASDLQSMSPQDLAAQITKMLQQQNITVPPSLQNMSTSDLATQLASLLQQNNATSSAGSSGIGSSGIGSGLTSDLIASQSATIQGVQTKDDIAKNISDMLEQQQQQGATTLGPAQLQQLKAELTQLQSAPGTISPDTMSQLTTDVGNFLSGQGISQSTITSFLADLAQSLQQKDQTSSTDASATTAAATTVTPAVTAAAAVAVQPVVQQPQITNYSSSGNNSSATNSQTGSISPDYSNKGILSQDDKTPTLGGKDANVAPEATDTPVEQSAAAAQQSSQSSTPQPSLTGKIAGFSINPAMISDLANSENGTGTGTGNGSGSQGNNAQQAQDATGNVALQPLSADMMQTQNFTNYMSAARAGAPSSTTQQVAIQLQTNASAGMNTMNLQLEPAELGKVDVKLSFAKDGTVKAHMTVDKPETLAMLQKDSSHLQRALQQSGLSTDENSLSFDLRQQSQQQNMSGFNDGSKNSDEFGSHMDGNVSNALQAQLAIQSSGYITQSGVNIMV